MPLNRDQQIELMRDAAKRMDERMAVWLDQPVIRGLVCKPDPQQTPYVSKRVALNG